MARSILSQVRGVMKLLIVDTETTDITDEARVFEVGIVLYNVHTKLIETQFSTLMKLPDGEHISENASEVTGVHSNMLDSVDKTNAEYFSAILKLMENQADYAVAYNAEFDSRFFNGTQLPTISIPWVCAMNDITYKAARGKKNLTLTQLAIQSKLTVDGTQAHGALYDCQLIASIFRKVDKEALVAQCHRAQLPRIVVVARISYENRQLAKDAGFSWNGQTKKWTNSYVQGEVPTDLPFEVY